jgi:hypothetical protein
MNGDRHAAAGCAAGEGAAVTGQEADRGEETVTTKPDQQNSYAAIDIDTKRLRASEIRLFFALLCRNGHPVFLS